MAATIAQYQATQKGGPFALVSVPKPVTEQNEVAVRIKAIGLNPIDWKKLHFGLMVQSWPAMFGIDGAGVVEEVGEGVTNFKVGDEVFGVFGGEPKGAAFQEIAIVPQASLAKKPENISLEETASLPVCYVTAAAAIYGALKIPLPFLPGGATTGAKPTSVLVLGGSSAVGAAAIQILHLALDSATILTTSSTQHHVHLTSLGATKAFDQKSPTLVTDIKSATPEGKGVEMIIDAVGSGGTQTTIFDVFSADGPKEYAEVVTGAQFQVPESVKRHLIFGLSVFETPGGSDILTALTELVNQGKYKVPIRVKMVGHGLEAIAKGLDELKGGVSATKLVVSI